MFLSKVSSIKKASPFCSTPKFIRTISSKIKEFGGATKCPLVVKSIVVESGEFENKMTLWEEALNTKDTKKAAEIYKEVTAKQKIVG